LLLLKVKEDFVALPRFSLASIAVAVVILAIDFGLIRSVFFSDETEAWQALAFLLLPLIDALLILLYRLRRRERRTAGAVGFLMAGALATATMFAASLPEGEFWFGTIRVIERPIAMAIVNGLTRRFGNAVMHTAPVELILVILFELLLPMTLLCLPLLLAGLIGGWIVRGVAARAGSRDGVHAPPTGQQAFGMWR
jgi:hypothetical protein